jgi:nitrite reductase (NADH) small subunit
LVNGDWIDVCALSDITPGTGVCALIGREQIAIFRVGPKDELFAIGNFDPFSHAFVLSRGIVGDRKGTPKVSSPIFKQSFDLATGCCLDDPSVTVPAYGARLVDGRVEVRLTRSEGAASHE